MGQRGTHLELAEMPRNLGRQCNICSDAGSKPAASTAQRDYKTAAGVEFVLETGEFWAGASDAFP